MGNLLWKSEQNHITYKSTYKTINRCQGMLSVFKDWKLLSTVIANL